MDLPIRRLFDPSALPERDARGFCRHPDLADPRWFVHPSSKLLDDHFFAQCGYEIHALWFLASATTEAIDAYTSTSSVRSWEPTAPAGEGWTLLMIGDTTEGPAAFFVRERSAVEGGLSPTLSRVTNLLGLLRAVRQRLERDTPRGFEGVAPGIGGERRGLVSQLDAAIDEVEAAERAPRSVMALPFDAEIREILGRLSFECTGIAELLRKMGRKIELRSDAEQAAVLHWMLGHYIKYGRGWRATATAELRSGARNALDEALASLLLAGSRRASRT